MKVIIYIYIYIYIYICKGYIYIYKGYIRIYKGYIYKGSETFISVRPLLTLSTHVASGILFIRTIFIEFFYLGTKATVEKCRC